MVPIIDFQERSIKGPVMKSDDFDIAFSMKVRELVAKYNIKYKAEELICDDATADAVFQAGVELLADIGLYHLDTKRVVKFTKEEILEIAAKSKANPGKVSFGQGDDEMTLEYRTGDDPRPPTLFAGGAGPIHEDLFMPYVQTFAQEERIKGMGIAPGLERLGDIEPKAGTLSELYVGLWEQRRLLEVLERVGRPGMNMGLLCTVSTIGGTMGCIGPGLRQPHNTMIGVHIIPEQKIDWTRLILAHFCEERGIVPWQSAISLVGGLCRDAADTAVSLIANMLGQMSYAHGPTSSLWSNHMDAIGTFGTPSTTWAVCTAARASERNIRIAIGISNPLSYQVGKQIGREKTNSPFCMAAAQAILYVASGVAYFWMAGNTGLEARMIIEVIDATAGMDRARASDLANAIMRNVNEQLGEAHVPEAFTDKYDVKTVKPKPEYESVLNRGKEFLARMGMPYK